MKKILSILFLLVSLSLNAQTYQDTVIAPTGFTPNLTTNYEFKPKVVGYDNYELYIFNRNGEIIYQGSKWDGTYKGVLMHRGVYIWKVVAYKGSEYTEYYGHITLL